jgi:hypothetical protein
VLCVAVGGQLAHDGRRVGVAGFGDRPVTLAQGQVLGVGAAQRGDPFVGLLPP